MATYKDPKATPKDGLWWLDATESGSVIYTMGSVMYYFSLATVMVPIQKA
jgi:hypothetical protein